MSPDFDSEDGDHATAIAAATFAIYSNDESRVRYNQKINGQGPNSPLSRVNTRKEDPVRFPEPGRVSRRPSSNNARGRQGKRNILTFPEYSLKTIVIELLSDKRHLQIASQLLPDMPYLE